MPSRIYLLDNNGETLRSLEERPYDNEELLQGLLEKHPDLLAGDQIDETAPRRWLLVDREVGVPIKEDAVGGMLLDHLFLDQDGIPTLVEVKRSSDTRIRREVVGQMLDYAAHAVAYWPAETIRARFEARCQHGGGDPDQLVAHLIIPSRMRMQTLRLSGTGSRPTCARVGSGSSLSPMRFRPNSGGSSSSSTGSWTQWKCWPSR